MWVRKAGNGQGSENMNEPNRQTVVVTGTGVVTSLGQGKADNWAKLTGGVSGIKTISRFSTEGLATRIAGTVDFLGVPESALPLTFDLADAALEEAIGESGLEGDFPGPLYVAVPPVETEWPQRLLVWKRGDVGEEDSYRRCLSGARKDRSGINYDDFLYGSVADRIRDKYGTRGAPVSLSTACASGASALQLGVEAIRRGDCEAALCAGTDGSIHPESLLRFSLLSALSTRNDPPEAAAKPFSKNRDGFVMAEGAGAVVLESLEHAQARGAEILAVVDGIGERADDFHRTRSKPDGSAIIGAVRNVIADAGLEPGDIGYVNAHGTGTPENDKMEHLALHAVFGDHLDAMLVSSNKSMVGHTLTAAGAVEAVFSILALRNNRVPPTINYQEADPSITMDVVPNVARDASIDHVMSNSFGFGGQNVCIVFGAP